MKNILSCMAVTVAMLPSLLSAETVIEVNLDNIKQYEVVQIIRFEGGGGKSVLNDTIRDGKSSFNSRKLTKPLLLANVSPTTSLARSSKRETSLSITTCMTSTKRYITWLIIKANGCS